jgi:cysteine desulfurase
MKTIADLAHEKGALVHVDAAQAIGKIPVDVNALGADLLSVAGHKLYAPKGVGALYVRKNVSLRKLLLGGGQEMGLRPGTENVPYLVGLGEACAIAKAELGVREATLSKLRELFWHGLREGVPGLRLSGHPEHRLPNTLNVRFPNAKGSEILTRASEIAASTGSACHDGDETPSNVLLAMGITPTDALGAVRLSVGCGTTEEDVTLATRALVNA